MESKQTTMNQYEPQTVMHPGVDLAEKLIELGWSTDLLSSKTGESQDHILAVIRGKKDIEIEFATKLEVELLIPQAYWLARQNRFNESRYKAMSDAKKGPYTKDNCEPFLNAAEKGMATFGISGFRRTYSKLFQVIIDTMNDCYAAGAYKKPEMSDKTGPYNAQWNDDRKCWIVSGPFNDGFGYPTKASAAHVAVGFNQVHDAAYAASAASKEQEVAKLQVFKDYVHKRLDDHGVPTHPIGEHMDAGCRVGQRLDIALASSKVTKQAIKETLRQWVLDHDGPDMFNAEENDDASKAMIEDLDVRLDKLTK